MRYETEQIGGALVVKLYGEIDQHCVSEIRDDIDRQIAIRNINSLIVDLGGVEFMDSSGIGVIMGRYKRIYMLGGEVCAVHANERMKKILTMSGVTKITQIYEEEK